MFTDEWKKIKIGVKLRRTTDNTIWQVFEMIDFAHYKVKAISTIPKGSPNILTISNKSIDWSTILNFYEFSYIITKKIYANSEAEAKNIIFNQNEGYYIEGSEFKLIDKQEII